jgi:RNA polymerase sigma-70 factor (ECF subfamily)
MMVEDASDSQLVAAARDGDRDSLDRLLRRHVDMIHAVCARITGNPADAADAAQEALIAIVRGLPRFDERASVRTWMYRVATNACLDELRRRGRRPVTAVTETFDRAGDGPGLDAGVTDRLTIDAALARIPEEFRVAVVLRDVQGMDYAQIADVLDVPLGTVRSRIARGRAPLAALLGDPDGAPTGTRTPPSDVQEGAHD